MCRKIKEKRRIQYVMCFGIVVLGVFVSATACGRQEPSVMQSVETITEGCAADMEDEAEKSSAAIESSSAVMEDMPESTSALDNSGESMPTYAGISEEVQMYLGDGPLDTRLEEAIEENVILGDDTEIEACEWVDEEKSCLHIWVQYKEKPEDNYQHKEDYFFFREGEEIQVLYVDYPTKDWHNTSEDRYVWDACDFTAHLEDVTFDGKDDLIIFLGYAGSHADTVHGAYVYEDGFYHYNSSFESIPNYMVDTEKRFIRGHAVDSAMYAEDYVFIYEDDEFVKVSYHYYRLDYDSCW